MQVLLLHKNLILNTFSPSSKLSKHITQENTHTQKMTSTTQQTRSLTCDQDFLSSLVKYFFQLSKVYILISLEYCFS
ncbi:unnamed protein product [Amoebophrya sp. A25]|nr:unnamed protein product [Amoebophrya sp. A25]|eukprot:GSA25T00011279001.1